MSCPILPPHSKRFRYVNGVPVWGLEDQRVVIRLDEPSEPLRIWHPVISADGFRSWMEQCMLDAHKLTLTAFLTWAKDGFAGDDLDRASVRQSLAIAEAWMKWRPRV